MPVCAAPEQRGRRRPRSVVVIGIGAIDPVESAVAGVMLVAAVLAVLGIAAGAVRGRSRRVRRHAAVPPPPLDGQLEG